MLPQGQREPLYLSHRSAGRRDGSPVIGGVRVRVALRRHTQRLGQLGVAVVDAIVDGLQLMSVPLGLVPNQGRVKHVYPKRKKERVSNGGGEGGANDT